MAWNPFGQQSNPNPGWAPGTSAPPPATQFNYASSVPLANGAAGLHQAVSNITNGTLPPGTSMADANWLNYGGASSGPQQWTNYYQGLGATASNTVGAQRNAAMSQATQAMQPYQAVAGSGQTQWNGAAGTATGMGSLAQQQLAAAGAGTDQVAQMYQAQANGTGPNVAASTLGQGAAAGIRAQLAAAASTRGGAAMQAAAGQNAAIQNANITGAAAGNAANAEAQAQLQGQQNLGQYEQGAQTGLAGAANNQLSTTGNLGLGYGNLGEGAAATGLQVGTQAGEAYSTEQQQAQQAYEQMAQQVQQNQLQANIAQNQANKGLQGTEDQISAQQTSSLIGGAGAALGTGLMLAASDESLKTDLSPQGDSAPGDLPAPQANASGVTPYQASQAPNGAPAGLSKDQLKSAIGFFRNGWSQAFASRPIQASPQAPNIGMPGQPLTMSDERAKTAVSPAPTADALLDMLAKSKSTFAYKNPQDEPLSPLHPKLPGARFGGVMAQDLERTPEIGPQLVTDTPHGKMLEPQAVQSAMLMGLGRLAERMTALEGRR
jgi:hypothetical protein